MKVNYGIYLSVNSASIAKMEDGMPVILKSDTQRDKIPVCVMVTRSGYIVGGKAFNNLISDKKKKLINPNYKSNIFLEFTRTLGSDKTYYSTNTNKSFTSTELVAEIIKTLISFEKSKDVNAAVITIPDTFKSNQISAVKEAGRLAGLQQVEILQESVAASLVFGLDSVKFQGFSLVFSFDDVFDVSLMKNNRIIDTEEDNYLGGKNLDFAIVDEIILPYIQENFVIDSILADEKKSNNFKESWKYLAKDTLEHLYNNEQYSIITNLYDDYGEDDEGEGFELNITITQADITKVLSPVFQNAIDISKSLLERNNLESSSLDSLILVGGSTLSPVLRKMLEEQICKPDTSIDPKSAIAKGAALYASTINVSEEIREQTRDKTKIQLEIANESSTIEIEEFVPVKILAEKTEGEIPEKTFVEIIREDQAWSSGKIEINTIGEVVEIHLNDGETNIFEVSLFDEKGKRLECEPNNFSIIQGKISGTATLAHNIGTAIKDKTTGRINFRTIKGLEKNKSIPALGTFNGIKTEFPLRPGVESDFINIPIYQGGHGAEGTRAIYNSHVSDVIISGADLPTILPENSDIDLMISIDKYQKITVTAYFPYLDYSTEIEVNTKESSLTEDWLREQVAKTEDNIDKLDSTKKEEFREKLNKVKNIFENKKSESGRLEARFELQKLAKEIDLIEKQNEWPNLEETLKEEFYRLEKANNDLGNDKTTGLVNQFRSQLDEVIRAKDVRLGNVLIEEIERFFSSLKKSTSTEMIKDLLFKLTEDGILPGEKFGLYYERLSNLSDDSNELTDLYNEIKAYE